MAIGTRKLAQLCRRVGMGLRAGLDMRTIWEKESQYGTGFNRSRIAFVSQRVAGGGSLSEALSSTNGYFPQFVCAMTNVGEQTGRLDDTFLKLADHYDQTLQLRRTFLMGVALPMLELSLALIVVPLILWFVTSLFNIDADPLGLGLRGSQSYLLYFFLLAVITCVLIALGYGFKQLLKASVVAKYVQMIPVLGACFRLIGLSRLAWSLSLANGAGMDIRSSMRLAIDSTQNGWLASEREAIDRRLLAGEEVYVTLKATQQYPHEFLAALETGELTGNIAETMAHVANDYQARVAALSKALTVIGSLLVWGLIAILLIILIINAFSGYVNTLNELSSPNAR